MAINCKAPGTNKKYRQRRSRDDNVVYVTRPRRRLSQTKRPSVVRTVEERNPGFGPFECTTTSGAKVYDAWATEDRRDRRTWQQSQAPQVETAFGGDGSGEFISLADEGYDAETDGALLDCCRTNSPSAFEEERKRRSRAPSPEPLPQRWSSVRSIEEKPRIKRIKLVKAAKGTTKGSKRTQAIPKLRKISGKSYASVERASTVRLSLRATRHRTWRSEACG